MAYIKQTCQCGDVVSAEKLNHMEEGIEECCGGGGAEPLIVNKVNTGTDLDPVMTLDHTFQEIFDAYMLGKAVLITDGGYDTWLVYGASGGELGYILYTRNYTYVANELNGYPVEN